MSSAPTPTPIRVVRARRTTIAVVRTDPEQITLHTIQDYELSTLSDMSRPYSLGFATTALGAVLGLAPTVMEIIGRRSNGLSMADMWTMLLAGGCLAAAIIFGIVAGRGVIEANKTIRAIRARPTTPL